MDTIEFYKKNGEIMYSVSDDDVSVDDNGKNFIIQVTHTIPKDNIGKVIVHRTTKHDIVIRV